MELTLLAQGREHDPTVLRAVSGSDVIRASQTSALYCDQARRELADAVSAATSAPVIQVETVDLDQIVARHAGEQVIVACAGEVIRDFVAAVLDVAAQAVPLPAPGALTRVAISRSDVRSLLCFNETLHLLSAVDVPTSEQDRAEVTTR